MERRLIYLGGNGHCAARLGPARDSLSRLAAKGAMVPFDLTDVPYPGFEDRPRALDFEAFLKSVSGSIAAATIPGAKILLIFRRVRTGDRLRLDGLRGLVEVLV